MTMYHFAVYDSATGNVLRMGRSSNERVLEVQALAEGEALYVGEIDPETTYLPQGIPTPKSPEAAVVTDLEVKALAGRLLSYTDWYVTRQQEGGAAIPAEVLAYRQAVREASNAIEAMDPIPADFRDPKYWPVRP
jgi:hypothetical protein